MKNEEDEAFDDMARRQGMWGGGFPSKRKAAMDKINSHFVEAYKKMYEDRAKYGTSWSKDGERIDPASVYLEEPAQEPVQEPVAWGFMNDAGAIYDCISPEAHDECEGSYTVPLYTTPSLPVQPVQEPDALTIAYQSGFYDGRKAALSKREWIGLTDEDGCAMPQAWWDGALWAEAKLKEKNA